MSLSEEIERLVTMRDAGHLSDEEFCQAKQAALTASNDPGRSTADEPHPVNTLSEDIDPVRAQQEWVGTRRKIRRNGFGYFMAGIASTLVIVLALGYAVYARGTLVLDLNHRSGMLTNGAEISSLESVKTGSDPATGPTPQATVDSGSTATETGVTVPEVIGLSLQEAASSLTNVGLVARQYDIDGLGCVSQPAVAVQDPSADSKVASGTVVSVGFHSHVPGSRVNQFGRTVISCSYNGNG